MNSISDKIRNILIAMPDSVIKNTKAKYFLVKLENEGVKITPSVRSTLSILLKKYKENSIKNSPKKEIVSDKFKNLDSFVKAGIRFVISVGNIKTARQILDEVEGILDEQDLKI